MRRFLLATALILGLAMSANAESHFTVIAPPDWTPAITTDNPTVFVRAWFTEGTPAGAVMGADVISGNMAAGALTPVDVTIYEGTNQVLCLNGTAEIENAPETRVTAVPACSTFPFGELVPFTIQAPVR